MNVDLAHRFEDGDGYDRFMGRWSRAVGEVFLDWVGHRSGALWLEVGCGTGSLTQLILEKSAPESLVAIDPAVAQIQHAHPRAQTHGAKFGVADAHSLPFNEATFDVVVSGLVLNFIRDQVRALLEMRRVAVRGGVVTGYVWDFAAELSPSWPLRIGLRESGVVAPQVPGAAGSSVDELRVLFERAGLEQISLRSFEVTVAFANFEDFWQSQTQRYSPVGKLVASLKRSERLRLSANVRAMLPMRTDGQIEYSARANAVKARVPD
jgi:ubiquinone/menaquinone biosynthesis C-methylase UbiE